MKPIKLLLLFSLFFVPDVWAVKAWQEPLTVTQPDGTVFTAYTHGDEHFSWYASADSVILFRDNYTFYIATIRRDGTIASSGLLAHEKPLRSKSELEAVARQNRTLFFNKATLSLHKARRREPVAPDPILFPHTGSPRAIVILAEYQDTLFTLPNPRKSFNQFLNHLGTPTDFGHGEGKNRSSVKQYFKDMSNGRFTPQFDIYGPIKLSKNLAYYGGNTTGSGNDEQEDELVAEACRLMDDSLDFAQYDSNHDGIVDLVYVIYAGYGQNMGAPANTMWPKSFTTYYTTKDHVQVRRCGISNELLGNATSPAAKWISGIGLFCHEFSHCLGLPDFYPTKQAARGDNQGMEAWSLMDYGSYTDNGWCPTAYTAWEREAFGWLTIDTLKDQQQVTLRNIDTGGKAYRIINKLNTTGKEYYILQNIQNEQWNTKLRGHGMLVYHVNYEAGAFSLSSNAVNNIKGKPRMTIVPADKLLLSSYSTSNLSTFKNQLKGDPFPGTAEVTSLTDASNLPNYAPWTGGLLNQPIYNIREEDKTIYFDFMRDYATSIEKLAADDASPAADGRIYSIDGRFVGYDKHRLPKGIYIMNKKKFVVQ